MNAPRVINFAKRYDAVYTPRVLADFVSQHILEAAQYQPIERTLRILDPAVGHGELLISLLRCLGCRHNAKIEVYGFETDSKALEIARHRLEQEFSELSINLHLGNFLDFAVESFRQGDHGGFFRSSFPDAYDFIIANPPYVRTQIIGSKQAQLLSDQWGLSGCIDLYYAFILGISQVLSPQGTAGIIISNRFMTTLSGASVRQAIFERFHIRHAWDLGDTRLFDAAVLPAVLLVQGKDGSHSDTPAFTSIYETSKPTTLSATHPISALKQEGVIKVDDGRKFHVQHGKLDTNGKPDGVWRVATKSNDHWLSMVEVRRWGTFRDIGKVRVGVKTCADKIFIRSDWHDMANTDQPELLRPLTTHHIARCFKALRSDQPSHILYPHEVYKGRRRAVNLAEYPRSKAYLMQHRSVLEARKYVIEAGRRWYEIWVPQDPMAWRGPKLVFRDIADEPTFWIDLEGSVVNGDCYWLVPQNPDNTEVLWLAAAVANSTFIKHYYDLCFNNKLYSGRRRFMSQYVEKFPLPDPNRPLSKSIIKKAKRIHKLTPSPPAELLKSELNSMVWLALTGQTASSM